ncbi:MAG: class II aldolase/adducin family protein [Anaerolineae bacterium]|nr:class II aldolase/adducin family protein [Anaerolineae bacterium]
MSHYQPFKQQVLDTCQELTHQGYLIGTGGNVSIRIEGEEALAITPSSRDYLGLTLDDICVYAFDKTPLEGELTPSIETGMHTAVYQNRPDVNAVIHTHQPTASVFTIINTPIPALFDEQVTQLGDCVEIVPYGMSGSPDLAGNLAARLDNQCNAYLLQNHGIICMGVSMDVAKTNIKVLEKCAQVYQAALATGKEITYLSKESADSFFGMLRSEQRKEIRRKKKLTRQSND